MAVFIDSGPLSATDRLRDVPREKWHSLMLVRRYFLKVHLSYDCRCLVEFVNDAKAMFEELGFASVEHMICEGYGLEPDEIAIAVRWLELNPPKEPVALEQAITLGRHGGDRKSEKVKDQGGESTLKYIKNTKAHWLARLDRDGLTELAGKVRAGEMSANAAAIAAGFRKKPVKRCPKCGHEW